MYTNPMQMDQQQAQQQQQNDSQQKMFQQMQLAQMLRGQGDTNMTKTASGLGSLLGQGMGSGMFSFGGGE